MQAIIKIDGIQPSALTVLHGALKQPYMHTPEQEIVPNITTTRDEPTKVPYAKIMCSEFDPESDTYTVTLTLNLIIPGGLITPGRSANQLDTFAPLNALVGLFKSIDPRLLPDAVAAPTSKFDNALVEKIASEILGEMSTCDIANGTTGEIIVPANCRINRLHIRQLVSDIAGLMIGQSETDDHIIGTLRRIQLEQKSAQTG